MMETEINRDRDDKDREQERPLWNHPTSDRALNSNLIENGMQKVGQKE